MGTRVRAYGPNEIRARARLTRLRVLARQLQSPLLLLLVFAAAASALTAEWIDAAIVLTVVVAAAAIGYVREYSAQTAAEALRARVRSRARVMRDGKPVTVPLHAVVPGDLALLSAGSLVPADAVILEATDFFVSEAVLTGESFPVEKRAAPVASSATLAQRVNCVFWAPTCEAAPRAHRRRDRRIDPVRRHRAPADSAAARDRVRSRNPPVRLPADDGDARHGAARVRRPHVPRTAAARNASVLHRARGGPQPGAPAGHPQREPGQRRARDGSAWGAGAPAHRHREPRKHGRAVHGQDRYAHRGCRPRRRRV